MTFEVRDLAARYGKGEPLVLRGVTMSVPRGSLYAVLGPNGSGKSTLMRAVLGVLPLERGSVRIEGRDLEGWGRRELARAVGAVPQAEHITFPFTVRDFVAMGRYPHLGPLSPEGERDRTAVASALERCRVGDLAHRHLSTLSGGELQRVRIARALAQEPRSLVLDEPTANLDLKHEMAIFHLLRASANEGLTVLVITHHINLAARFADRLLVLHKGSVAAEGTVSEVFRREILEEVYQWPVAVREDSVAGAPQAIPLQAADSASSRRSL